MAKRGIFEAVLVVIILFSVAGIIMIHNGTILGKSIIIADKNISKVELNETFANLNEITINEIKQQGNIINVSYSFDNSKYIGDGITIDLWITDSNSTIIKKLKDDFSIISNGLIYREVSFNIGNNSPGIYKIFISTNDEPNNNISEDFVYGSSVLTGNTILENPSYKIAGYWIFILIIAIALFLIIKRSTHDKDYKKF